MCWLWIQYYSCCLSLRSAAQLLFDLVSNNPSLIQIYDSFILRSISSHAISSSHSRVYSAKDAKPTKNKTKQNKKNRNKLDTNNWILSGQLTHIQSIHTQRWEKKGKGSAFTRRHIGECKCLPRTLQRPERERLKTLLCAHSSSCVTTHTHTHRFFFEKI